MNDQDITCRYTFTGKQHGRAMGCYWRHARVKWFVLVCMLLVLFGTVYGELYPGDSGTPRTVTALSVILDFLPIVCFFGILFVAILVFGRLAFAAQLSSIKSLSMPLMRAVSMSAAP